MNESLFVNKNQRRAYTILRWQVFSFGRTVEPLSLSGNGRQWWTFFHIETPKWIRVLRKFVQNSQDDFRVEPRIAQCLRLRSHIGRFNRHFGQFILSAPNEHDDDDEGRPEMILPISSCWGSGSCHLVSASFGSTRLTNKKREREEECSKVHALRV